MKTYQRSAKFVELKKYDHLAKEHDFVEVCDWHNGEGFDVTIGDRLIQLTFGELDAINALVLYRE